MYLASPWLEVQKVVGVGVQVPSGTPRCHGSQRLLWQWAPQGVGEMGGLESDMERKLT